MESKIKILGVSFDAVNQSEASELIFSACQNKNQKPFIVVTPNPLMVMNAQKNNTLFSALSSANLSLADGIGIITAAKRMGAPLPERVTGIDTAYDVINKLAKINGSVYLFGSLPGIAEAAAVELTATFPSLRIVGVHHGYFEGDEKIIENIVLSAPDLLIVCLGSPKQEIWAHNHKKELRGVGAVMCLGGALDVWSGKVKRAPTIFIKLRLEWLWRMIREPKRIKGLPKIIKFRVLTRNNLQKHSNNK